MYSAPWVPCLVDTCAIWDFNIIYYYYCLLPSKFLFWQLFWVITNSVSRAFNVNNPFVWQVPASLMLWSTTLTRPRSTSPCRSQQVTLTASSSSTLPTTVWPAISRSSPRPAHCRTVSMVWYLGRSTQFPSALTSDRRVGKVRSWSSQHVSDSVKILPLPCLHTVVCWLNSYV